MDISSADGKAMTSGGKLSVRAAAADRCERIAASLPCAELRVNARVRRRQLRGHVDRILAAVEGSALARSFYAHMRRDQDF